MENEPDVQENEPTALEKLVTELELANELQIFSIGNYLDDLAGQNQMLWGIRQAHFSTILEKYGKNQKKEEKAKAKEQKKGWW